MVQLDANDAIPVSVAGIKRGHCPEPTASPVLSAIILRHSIQSRFMIPRGSCEKHFRYNSGLSLSSGSTINYRPQHAVAKAEEASERRLHTKKLQSNWAIMATQFWCITAQACPCMSDDLATRSSKVQEPPLLVPASENQTKVDLTGGEYATLVLLICTSIQSPELFVSTNDKAFGRGPRPVETMQVPSP